MAGSPLTSSICLNLLHFSITQNEEYRRPWKEWRGPFFDRPFLRIWDTFSGSQPGESNCMSSRNPHQPLRTRESRKEALAIHANHHIWEPTPFISFTTDDSAIESLAEMRIERRGTQTLTVINPNVRVTNRLPILDMAAEMSYYGVHNPYGKSYYYKNHYLCLWEVAEAEVIGSWAWDDLQKNVNWYNEIVLPAFKEHDLKVSRVTPDGKTFDLSSLEDALPLFDEYSDGEDWNSEKWTSSSDEQLGNMKNWSDWGDTDDEVEEANATDDMFKILEGDWS